MEEKSVEIVEANNRADLRTPELLLAVMVCAFFVAAYFYHPNEAKDGALISAFSMAVGYYLSTQRRKAGTE